MFNNNLSVNMDIIGEIETPAMTAAQMMWSGAVTACCTFHPCG